MSTNGNNTVSDKDACQWIFLLNGSILNAENDRDGKPSVCKLRHPRTNSGSMFLFSHKDELVYEITKFHEPCRSWFLNQTVQQDGGLYITSLVDAIFLALPYFIQSAKAGKYQLSDQIIIDDDFPECERLCRCLSEVNMEQIADIKGTGSIKAYRYNEEKTLSWLRKKVEHVAERLEGENINVSGGSLSHNFVRSAKTANSSAEDYLRYAHGMISDYIPLEVSKSLRENLKIMDPEPLKHEKPDSAESLPKKPRLQKVEATEDYSQIGSIKEESKKGPKTAAQSKLNKVDKKGMKSISSFFSPKSKK